MLGHSMMNTNRSFILLRIANFPMEAIMNRLSSKIKGKSSSRLNSQNVAFVSSDNSSSTNETINTAHSVSAASSKDQASTAL
ncbi:hypothetical protein Tco_0389689 [Tanacetum coccineum]